MTAVPQGNTPRPTSGWSTANRCLAGLSTGGWCSQQRLKPSTGLAGPRPLTPTPPPPPENWQGSAGRPGQRPRKEEFLATGGRKSVVFPPGVFILKILGILWRIQSSMKTMKKNLTPPPPPSLPTGTPMLRVQTPKYMAQNDHRDEAVILRQICWGPGTPRPPPAAPPNTPPPPPILPPPRSQDSGAPNAVQTIRCRCDGACGCDQFCSLVPACQRLGRAGVLRRPLGPATAERRFRQPFGFDLQ